RRRGRAIGGIHRDVSAGRRQRRSFAGPVEMGRGGPKNGKERRLKKGRGHTGGGVVPCRRRPLLTRPEWDEWRDRDRHATGDGRFTNQRHRGSALRYRKWTP